MLIRVLLATLLIPSKLQKQHEPRLTPRNSMNEKNEVLARSRGTFIAIDPEKMFKKFAKR